MIPYIGGKYRQAKWIWEIVNKHIDMNKIDTYIEPFGGAFWNYFKNDINIKNIIYNDYNILMYNMFYTFKYKRKEILETVVGKEILELKDIDKIIKNIKKWKIPEKDIKLFNKYKSLLLDIIENNKNFKIPNVELAIAQFYIYTHTYSSLSIQKHTKLITNSNHKTHKSVIKKLLTPYYINKLNKITKFENCDYNEILDKYDNHNTLFYLDPPYYGKEKYYSNHKFNKNEHEKLLKRLQNIRGKFVLSYYNFPILEKYLPKEKYIWERKKYKKISSNLNKKTEGEEILIIKN